MIVKNRNELWGRALVDELARSGVRHVFVSPGSRSAPIVLAAASDPRIRLHVQLDERSAGFLAMGVGKATGTVGAVVTTSGTAVANLFPAVVEAAQSGTPLLALTADRPARLRGADANQTIDQVRIFGGYPLYFADLSTDEASERALRHLRSVACLAVARAMGDPAGPVHLNLSFSKPLEPVLVAGDLPPELADGTSEASSGRPDGAPWTRSDRARGSPSEADVEFVVDALRSARSPVLVAGILPRPWEAGPAIRRAAAALGVPLLADALSGARYGRAGDAALVGGYDVILRDEASRDDLRPDLVVRVGAAPTSTALNALLADRCRVPHVLVDGGGRWKDHASSASRLVGADPVLLLEAVARRFQARGSWPNVARWEAAERAVARGVEQPAGVSPEGAVARAVVGAADHDDLVFVSSSMPVRDVDTFVPVASEEVVVIGNRGASGIDGIISTAAGASIGSSRRVLALVGDLALLHDANGLASLRDPAARVIVVVVNNDGGGIFHLLPIRGFEPEFTNLFVTPHGRDISDLARFHDLPHVVVAEPTAAAVAESLRQAAGWDRSGIVEVRTVRAINQRDRHEAIRRLVDDVARALQDQH